MASKVRAKPGSSRWLRKRSDIDIIANILDEARKGSRKTRVMYRCNLSHRQLQVYLNLIQDMGLLASHSEFFITTAKGNKFLEVYRTLKALMT
jgi:predicted transcriptional regulator